MILNPRFPPHFRAPPTRNRPADLRIAEDEITGSTREQRWTEEQLDELRCRWARGHTATEIAEALGRSRNSILGKVNRLGLKREELAA